MAKKNLISQYKVKIYFLVSFLMQRYIVILISEILVDPDEATGL